MKTYYEVGAYSFDINARKLHFSEIIRTHIRSNGEAVTTLYEEVNTRQGNGGEFDGTIPVYFTSFHYGSDISMRFFVEDTLCEDALKAWDDYAKSVKLKYAIL